ncbi:MAG: GNAT family N-acetyltransferase [Gemmatimonadaceae bacterium]|nr:GNAT family N-acetyltransferase [Gemmatimonadaceae bacterium]
MPVRTSIRPAARADADAIWELVSVFAGEGLMLPRTREQIGIKLDGYVVASAAGRIVACAALDEYSPSLAEVSSVAVARSEHGAGLGTQVVLGVERLARARDIGELFAMSLTDSFFLSMNYQPTSISRYPEKLSRYDRLRADGVEIVPKRCFQKTLDAAWTRPQLMSESSSISGKVRRAG